jgi:predicted RNase H-related nuclease YkuK (DUF458 family)
MKTIHFRIIELTDYQVLITKDFDNEQDDAPFVTVISFFLENIKVDLKLNYKSEETRNSIFDNISEEQVQQSVNNAKSITQ